MIGLIGILPFMKSRSVVHTMRQSRHAPDAARVARMVGEFQSYLAAPASSSPKIKSTVKARSNSVPTKSTWCDRATKIARLFGHGFTGLGHTMSSTAVATTPQGTFRRKIHRQVLCCEITPPVERQYEAGRA